MVLSFIETWKRTKTKLSVRVKVIIIPLSFSAAALTEVQWRHDNISHVHHFIHAPAVCLTIHSDASLDGWGATDGVQTMGGLWDPTHELPHKYFGIICCKTGIRSPSWAH